MSLGAAPVAHHVRDARVRRTEQLVLTHPLVVEHLAEIPLAGVAEERDHEGVGIVEAARHAPWPCATA